MTGWLAQIIPWRSSRIFEQQCDMRSSAKIIVGLSGGVDSSVAALLLKQQGYEVVGLFMKNWEEDDSADYCAATEDLADAKAVADLVGIPLYTINFSSEYWDNVFETFLAEYRAGRTPNPDVLCNREIKFKAFLDHARRLGASHIATGHYARIISKSDGYHLYRAKDENKDQTYFLYMLGQEQLSHSRFPLGGMEKSAVRKLAEAAGFPNHKKKDSTGICFIGERKFQAFLSRYLPVRPGPIMTHDGKRVGEHQGVFYYTLGQRRGLGIGGVNGANQVPWFVVNKNIEQNILIVAQGHDHPLLHKQGLEISQVHWLSGHAPEFPVRCRARSRHRQILQACEVNYLGRSRCRVLFDRRQRAPTPGQSVVFYQDDECLGGGIIDRTFDP